MPIYEYKCQKCGAHTEVLQKINDKPLTKCVKCGGKVEKQWSNTSFQLKGSGWYVTDYAGKKSESKETKSASSTDLSSNAPASTDGGKASNESKTPSKESKKPATTTSE